jgi:outer membrane protein assembly complex protein YaeT
LEGLALILRSAEDSKARGGRPSVFSTFLWSALVGLSILLPDAFSQDNRPPLISGVEVWIDNLPRSENLGELISIKQGDKYSLKVITENVKQIYKTGLFSNVEVLKSGQEQLELKFMLTRKLVVRKIRFQGDKGISGKKLNEALYSLRADSFFSEEKLRRAREELKRGLNQEGYFLPEIDTSFRRNPKAPDVDVTFSIQAGKRFAVENISFTGNGPVSESDLKKKMKTREKGKYLPLRLEQDIAQLKSLYATKGFPRAEIELVDEKFNTAKGTIALSLNVNPYERIQIIIKGANVPVKLLEPIWQERIFEDWGLNEGEARILSYLRKKGFIYATVSSRIERKDSELQVIHQVSPRQKITIQNIRFEGMAHFSAAEIKDKLGIADRVLFFPAIGGERVFELPSEIQTFYESQGFPDVNVTLNFVNQGNKVTAVFSISEGKQQIIDDISFSGASGLTPETLLAQISIVKGGPYFLPDVQRDIQKLETFYLNQGFRGTKIEASTDALGDNRFRLTFKMQEGRKTKIQNLVITGSVVTRGKTIEREMRIREGDYAYYERIMASKRNLEKLGAFSEVKVEEIPVTHETENLVITLREGQRNFASVGLGLETRNEPFASAISINDIRLRGIAEFMRSNILGRAASLSFVSQLSPSEKRAVISWEQPYFLFSFPLRTVFNAWYEEEARKSFGYRREGVSLTEIKPVFSDVLLMTTLRYARTTLTYLDNPSDVDRLFYPYSTTSLAPSFIWDKRNDVFNPERGHFVSLALEWAFPLFQTESNFLKGVFKYQRFFPIASRVNLASTFRLGLGVGKMPIPERFFAGGSNSFRGEKFDELGPKNPASGKPVGGKALALFNIDLTFPLVSSLKDLSGVVFYDFGNVFYHRKDVKVGDLEHALGLGLRYRTPLGPLRFELGWNLDKPERKGKPLIFITIGNVF